MKRGDLSREFSKRVADHLMIERTALCRADLGFVFGNWAFCDELVQSAAECFHKGLFPRLIVTGGPANKQGVIEAHYLRDELIKKGVPNDCIMVEDTSTNTQENVENARKIISKELGPNGIKTVIGFGQLYAARRYIMTLKRRWPDVLAMHISVNGFDCERENWPAHIGLRKHVLSEWKKLDKYSKMDFITEVSIKNINEAAQSINKTNTARHNNDGPLPR